jgi:hypothetical protein
MGKDAYVQQATEYQPYYNWVHKLRQGLENQTFSQMCTPQGKRMQLSVTHSFEKRLKVISLWDC